MQGFDLLVRAAEGRATLLGVECLPAPATDDEQVGAAFLLIFDAGRILLSASPETDGLHALHLESKDDQPTGLVTAAEAEPWWRLIGSPLVAATLEDEGRRLRLQMREDGDSPRIVVLTLRAESIRAGLGQ